MVICPLFKQDEPALSCLLKDANLNDLPAAHKAKQPHCMNDNYIVNILKLAHKQQRKSSLQLRLPLANNDNAFPYSAEG